MIHLTRILGTWGKHHQYMQILPQQAAGHNLSIKDHSCAKISSKKAALCRCHDNAYHVRPRVWHDVCTTHVCRIYFSMCWLKYFCPPKAKNLSWPVRLFSTALQSTSRLLAGFCMQKPDHWSSKKQKASWLTCNSADAAYSSQCCMHTKADCGKDDVWCRAPGM